MVSSLSVFFNTIIKSFRNFFGVSYEEAVGSIYDHESKLISGEKVKLEKFRGKKMLIVNTASKCAYTPQFAELQKLQDAFPGTLQVLGFPSNDFLWQDPGPNQKIADFCLINYGVTFPMFEKISVRGRKTHPLYKWLRSKTGHSPAWNFCKYLIDERGEVIDFYLPKVKPLDERITGKIRS